jgi:hypothetical protein
MGMYFTKSVYANAEFYQILEYSLTMAQQNKWIVREKK